MKRLSALLVSLLLAATLLLGLALPVFADVDDDVFAPGSVVFTAGFEDAAYEATPDNANGARVYYLTINTAAPDDLVAQVTYTMDGQPFNGASEPGVYRITAHLPEGSFVNGRNERINELEATLTLYRRDPNYDVLVFDTDGSESEVVAQEDQSVKVPQDLLKKYSATKVLPFVLVKGDEDLTYVLSVSTYSDLYRSRDLSVNDLYVYEDGKLVPATEKGYQVELKDGRYTVSGVKTESAMTLVIAVNVFPWWIILIIVLAVLLVALLVCMFFIGRAKTKRDQKAEAEKKTDEPTNQAPENAPKKE